MSIIRTALASTLLLSVIALPCAGLSAAANAPAATPAATPAAAPVKVSAVDAAKNMFTVDANGKATTYKVDAKTAYVVPGKATATLADITVGAMVTVTAAAGSDLATKVDVAATK